jgi:peptidoglycan/LPS O-acetylase OafA/YrhL
VLLALGLLVLARRGREASDPFGAVPWIFLTVAVLCLVGRVATAATLPFTPKTHLFPTHLRLDGLMFGVLLAYAHHFHRERLEALLCGRELAASVAGGLLLVPAFVFDAYHTAAIPTVGLTAFYVGSGLLLLVLLRRGVGEGLLARGAAFIGARSYSIYLWHIVVLFEFDYLAKSGTGLVFASPAGIGMYITASFAVGIVMAKVVELPALRLRDRLMPPAAPGAVAGAPEASGPITSALAG